MSQPRKSWVGVVAHSSQCAESTYLYCCLLLSCEGCWDTGSTEILPLPPSGKACWDSKSPFRWAGSQSGKRRRKTTTLRVRSRQANPGRKNPTQPSRYRSHWEMPGVTRVPKQRCQTSPLDAWDDKPIRDALPGSAQGLLLIYREKLNKLL